MCILVFIQDLLSSGVVRWCVSGNHLFESNQSNYLFDEHETQLRTLSVASQALRARYDASRLDVNVREIVVSYAYTVHSSYAIGERIDVE
jgi:hypothetical protein